MQNNSSNPATYESPRIDDPQFRNGTNGSNGSDASPQRLREQTGVVKEDLRQLGQIARNATQEKLEEVKVAANGYLDHGKAKATHVEQRVSSYVQERPMRSVLIAGGIGALLGFLWSRS